MEDEILIECVREHTCLYDMADPKYMDIFHKSTIWRRIAEKLHQRALSNIFSVSFIVTEENCKKRWGNIRDQFKKKLNRSKTKSGQSAKVIRKYKYADILQFLLPYIQNRCTLSNIEEENDSENTIKRPENDEEIDVNGIEAIEQFSAISTPNVDPIEESSEIAPSTPATPHQPPDNPLPSSSRKSKVVRKRRIARQITQAASDQKESASFTLMKYIIEKNQKSQADIDPIEAFFQGLIPTVKRFSPYYQHLAKGRIFSVLHELELAQLNQPVPSSEIYTSPTYESSTSSTSVIGRLHGLHYRHTHQRPKNPPIKDEQPNQKHQM
ncbi:uncharacterized protein LOC123322637 [Coccinella septempunctata]|uniref:uncharacterized protein LOC123322637 n=1 Tax=Coccinella septempunctata TaxID=41139 RepID=UPI001D05C9F7|nr:uncharacterized protein LOC123322637 [Coccinella septempunctata]